MSTGNFQITMGNCIEMSTESVFRFVKRTATAITYLAPRYIRFPSDNETQTFVEEFYMIAQSLEL